MWKNVLVLVQFKSHHSIIVFQAAFMRHSLPKNVLVLVQFKSHHSIIVFQAAFMRHSLPKNVLVLVQFKSHYSIIVFQAAFMRHSLPKNVLILVQFKSQHSIIVFLVAFMRHSLPKKTGDHEFNAKQCKSGKCWSSGYKFDIYSRVIAPQLAKRVISPNDIFRYELAPVPTSIFDDFRDKRIDKSKSQLKKSCVVIPTDLSLMSVQFCGLSFQQIFIFHQCDIL